MKDSRDVEENIFWPVLGSENWCGEFKAADEDEIKSRFTMIENSSNSKRKRSPKVKINKSTTPEPSNIHR
jgi:DUF438 domain-containing protein